MDENVPRSRPGRWGKFAFLVDLFVGFVVLALMILMVKLSLPYF